MKPLTIDRLYEIMSEVFMQPELRFSPSMTAKDVPNWDSLNHSVLMMEISSETGVDISAEDAGKRETIGDLYEYICERVAGAQRASR